jgi:hypothetical protein
MAARIDEVFDLLAAGSKQARCYQCQSTPRHLPYASDQRQAPCRPPFPGPVTQAVGWA